MPLIEPDKRLEFGHWGPGELQLELIRAGANQWRVISCPTYYDPDGTANDAPPGVVVNGASIPWPFWYLVGHPMMGFFVMASVIHDRQCALGNLGFWREPSPVVHRRFWRMCRAGYTPRLRAWLMGFAVRWFGPRFKPRAGG